MDKFIEFSDWFRAYDPLLMEVIQKGYQLLHEGVNDVRFVFNAQEVIDGILQKITTGLPHFTSTLTTSPSGFSYKYPNRYKNIDLYIQWINISTQRNVDYDTISDEEIESHIGKSMQVIKPSYNPSKNMIIIPYAFGEGSFDKLDVNEQRHIMVRAVHQTSTIILHELRHWYDNIEFNINKNAYTKMSQLEDDTLDNIDFFINAVYALKNDPRFKALSASQYYNEMTELNAYISEFIDVVWNDVIYNGKSYNINDIFNKFSADFDIKSLTDDMNRRLKKRLYVFWSAISKIHLRPSDTSTSLKMELINLTSTQLRESVESIEYTHTYVMDKRNVVFFEANYYVDAEYRNWFKSKYVSNDRCISSHLCDCMTRLDCDVSPTKTWNTF